MIRRETLMQRITQAFRQTPVVAILGPRQCGKSTLAWEMARQSSSLFLDLEDPDDLNLLGQPRAALEPLRGLVILDEIQRLPQIFPLLRVLADRRPRPARFLLLGSASPQVVRGVSESLAGRVEFIDMSGFNLSEIGADNLSRLWLRGGLPRSFLARSDTASFHWRASFIRTFLERDLPLALDIRISPVTLRRFWLMLVHYHGQTWNGAELGRAMGLSDKTVRSYLDLLTGSFMIRQLPPWFANVGKRQVKSPKVFVRDTGLLHSLLGLPDRRALLSHPRLGASWEGFVIEQVLEACRPAEAFFWATQAGAELDLLFFHRGHPIGIECKFSDTPRLTRSMTTACEDLRLAGLWVIYPGASHWPLAPGIEAWPASRIADLPRAIDRRLRQLPVGSPKRPA